MIFVKKKWLILVIVLLVLLAVPIGCLLCTQARGISTGRYLETSNGTGVILIDDSPVCMVDLSRKGKLFDGLKSGDLIRIVHDGIEESYPGSTGVYFCRKLEDGTFDDLPKNVLQSLTELGWKAVDENQLTREIFTGTVQSVTEVYKDPGNSILKLQVPMLDETQILTLTLVEDSRLTLFDALSPGDTVMLEYVTESSGYREVLWLKECKTVSCARDYASMSLTLDAGWEYEIEEYDSGSGCFGICFWPRDCEDCKLQLRFYPDGYGVCGTGLDTKEIRLLSGLRGIQGTYDNKSVWDYITFPDLPGAYVLNNAATEESWALYGEEAMELLRSMSLAEGIIQAPEATEIAAKELEATATIRSYRFDSCEGEWLVTFVQDEVLYAVRVGVDGTILGTAVYDEEIRAEKPVIYLYPRKETMVSLMLDYDGVLTSTYPSYKNGWNVLARPDGTLTDPDTGREYYCLFWEGVSSRAYDLSTGFVVAGADTKDFLETVLSQMGLTDREANEFIIYWLPRMEGNPYNLISFQWEDYTDSAVLTVDPAPDSILRVFMAWKALDAPVAVSPQTIPQWERTGFALVEWGGAEITETPKT